ncbi:hypothetical protein PX554_00560 [Sphingomonas sp. H39-1-10]|uniref:hypothetical protein n=1 Tax=Sphingomonas TaxID=13687 RepID=UPI000886F9AE|nr:MULTISPECIES: hypothetical protein [Sphingomonas]MDF0486606.1 hypothetical protein [Sphingomonas pollutisoli]SDA36775.1 hypothetical protein SAMN03159340_03878 [Sphingomonas sp. NFR15]
MTSATSLVRQVARRAGLLPRDYASAAFGVPRRWSNAELRRFAPLFEGAAVNVSAWEDRDKEGRFYRSYFVSASSWSITNFGTDQGALQGADNEIFLDLEAELPPSLSRKFATVFNHTTLEHIWNFRLAFHNLCAMSSDVVIIVLPWLQPQHADYGDYWRFSPQATTRLFEEEGFEPLYLSWTQTPNAAVYIFAIASRQHGKWNAHFPAPPIRSCDPASLLTTKGAAGTCAF